MVEADDDDGEGDENDDDLTRPGTPLIPPSPISTTSRSSSTTIDRLRKSLGRLEFADDPDSLVLRIGVDCCCCCCCCGRA